MSMTPTAIQTSSITASSRSAGTGDRSHATCITSASARNRICRRMSEAAEIAEAQQKGIDIFSGNRPDVPKGETYDVEGLPLARPFKITKIGPVSLFVDDVDEAEAFYTQRLGLTRSEGAEYHGARCAFLRCGLEHHSLGLFPKELRKTLGLRSDTTCMSFGVELGR